MRGSKVPAHLLPSLRARHPSFQGPGEYVQMRKEPSCIVILELTKNMTNRPPSRENAYECSVRYVFHSGSVCRTHPEEHKGPEAKLFQHRRRHLPNNEVIHLKKRLALAGRGMRVSRNIPNLKTLQWTLLCRGPTARSARILDQSYRKNSQTEAKSYFRNVSANIPKPCELTSAMMIPIAIKSA